MRLSIIRVSRNSKRINVYYLHGECKCNSRQYPFSSISAMFLNNIQHPSDNSFILDGYSKSNFSRRNSDDITSDTDIKWESNFNYSVSVELYFSLSYVRLSG